MDKSSIALWLLAWVGFALRAYGLGRRALWDDEAFSVAIAGLDPARMATALVHDTFPPLHSAVLWASMQWLGPSEFAIRFASLIPSMLAVPAAYHLGRRLAGRDAGLWAALVTACSGFGVYFAQEARAYSWMVLLSMCSVYTFLGVMQALEREGRAGMGRWTRYVAASALMLHTHFLSVWVLVIEAVYFLGWWVMRRRRVGDHGAEGDHIGSPLRACTGRGSGALTGSPLWAWVAANAVIAVLFAPWMAFVVWQNASQAAGRPAVVAGGRAGLLGPLLWIWQEGRSTHGALSLVDTLRQALVSFSVGDFLPSRTALWLAAPFLALMAIGVVGLWRTRGRGRAVFLALYVLGPVLLTYGAAFPTSRPHWAKYFMMALPAFNVAVAAGIATLAGRTRPAATAGLAALAAMFVVGASGWGLWNYNANPAYARSDPRPAVSYLEALSTSNDALLCNPPGASPPFWHYYHAGLPWIDPTRQTVDAALLQDVANRRVGLWVVQNLPLGFDADESIERWLTTHAYRTFTDWVGQLVFRYYSMPAPGPAAVARDLGGEARFGEDIALQGYRLAVQAGGRTQVVQLELRWKALRRPSEEYMVGARAVDAAGRVWGRTNSAPLGNFRPTVGWDKGEVVLDHLGLLLWPGTPPGDYHVQVWLYRDADSQELPLRGAPEGMDVDGRLDLGSVSVPAPHDPPQVGMLALDAMTGGRPSGGVSLLGAQAAAGPLKPGERYAPTLFWQQAEPGTSQDVSLWLQDGDGRRFAAQTIRVGGWPAGTVRRDPRELDLPADLPDGRYALTVQVGESAPGELRAIIVKGRDKRFDTPRMGHAQVATYSGQVDLLGYDLGADRVAPGGEVALTLYWRAHAPMRTSYTVFNHLVGANGAVVGQWDSTPVGGTLPTTEWVTGEVIADRYRIPVKADAPPGESRLWIGWYDAASGARLPVDGGGDHVELGTAITLAK
jgi:hypothetical protein